MASQDSKLNSPNVGTYDFFGSSISISGINNNTYKAIIGAYNNLNQGNVYIFSNTSTTNWNYSSSLVSSNIEIGDNFGFSVDVSHDYSRYIVGAPYKGNNKGRVYIYNNTNLTSPVEIFAPDSGNFGYSVALNGDGTKAIVGAPYNGTNSSGNVYIYTSSNWSSPTHLYPSNPASYSLFGYSVDISNDGSKSIVGEPYRDIWEHGAAYIFNSSGTQEAQLSPNDPAEPYTARDNFGYSVSIDADGNTVVIGSIGSNNTGAAYIFTRTGTTWTQEAKLVSSDITTGDNFGHSVSISNDGNTVLVSTPLSSSRGAVYVFTRTGTGIWTQRDKIISDDISINDNFGNSIAISPNSLKAIIGAYKETPSNIFNGGSVYSFTLPENYSSNVNRTTHTIAPDYEDIGTIEKFNIYINGQAVENKPTTWSQSHVMTAPSTSNIFFANVPYNTNLSTLDPISDMKIGNFTFLERNVYDTWDNTHLDFYNEGPPDEMLSVGGNTIIEQKLGIGIKSPEKPLHILGDIRISDNIPTNTTIDISAKSSIFRQTSELVPVSQKSYEVHGTSFALSYDGTTAAVTSYVNPPGNDSFWYVYIYNWNGSSWEQNAVLQPDIVVSNDNFGSSLAFSSDGNTIIIGAYKDESVYVFSRSGFNSVSWSQEFKITASDSSLGNQFGYSVDTTKEASTIVVGSPKSNNNKGSIYVFTLSGLSWNETILTLSYSNTGDRLGTSVSITPDGNTILGTAEYADPVNVYNQTYSQESDAGSAYIWKKSGSTWSQLTWYPSPDTNEYPFSGIHSSTIAVSNIYSYGHRTEIYDFGDASGTITSSWDRFGASCDISDDGNTIIIGAPGRNTLYNSAGNYADMGSAYIFKYKYTNAQGNGYSWVENANIQASDYEIIGFFGSSVALSSDGNTAIIGAPRHDSGSGSVYIFTYSGISWSQQYKITPTVSFVNGFFGKSVCLSSNGLVTVLSNNALNVYEPIYIFYFNNTTEVTLQYISTNSYGEYEYSIGLESENPGGSTTFIYNPKTKIWTSIGTVYKITDIDSYADTVQLYNPSTVYIWLDTSSYLEFTNLYNNTGNENSSVYSYSLPEDFSEQYVNTLRIPSNLYVYDTIYTPNKIGININTPEKNLHVKGEIRITDETENIDFTTNKENVYEEAFLTLPFTGEDAFEPYDHYGQYVCISGDGYTAAVASHHANPGQQPYTQSDPGKVHIYTRTGNKWIQQTTLQPDDVSAGGHFGHGMTFTPDGNILVIGAYYTSVSDYTNTYISGAMYVYYRSGNTWTLNARLIPPVSNITSYSSFGRSVSINDKGTIILTTAKAEDNEQGALYTYELTGTVINGMNWSFVRRTTIPGAIAGDLLWSVKISGDGLSCVVGEIGVNSYSGRASIFTSYIAYSSGSPYPYYYTYWELQQTITPSDISAGDRLGLYVDISERGNTVALSARAQNNNSGAVYVYTKNEATWNQETKLVSQTTGGFFGETLQLSSDGNRLAIGQPGSDDSVYLYERKNSKWALRAKLTAGDELPPTDYGYRVSMTSSGDRIIVGDHNKTINNKISVGAAYIYSIPIVDSTCLVISSSIKSKNDVLVYRNTGLGTDFPEQKLHVLGDIRITNTDDVDISVLPSETQIQHTLFSSNGPAEINNFFGNFMNMSSDGNTIITTDIVNNYRVVDIFKRSGSTWYKQTQYNIGESINFLISSGDGKKIAYTTFPSGTTGFTHILTTTTGSHWSIENTIVNTDVIPSYAASSSKVAFSENGDTLFISLPDYELTPLYDGVTSNVQEAGAVDVYTYSSINNSWSKQDRLISDNPISGDRFGEIITATGDGNRVFISAYRATDYTKHRVEIFERSGTTWSHLQTLSSPETTINMSFGYKIASSKDYRNLCVSAPNYTQSTSRLYLYYYDTSSSNYSRLSSNIDSQNCILNNVSMSGDGKIIVVSELDTNLYTTGIPTGNTYVYHEVYNGGSSLSYTWPLLQQLISDFIPTTQYGVSLALNYKGDKCASTIKVGTIQHPFRYIDIYNISIVNKPTLNISESLSVEGDVGIGTTSPAYELDVVGDINFTGNIYQNNNLFSIGSSPTLTGIVRFDNPTVVKNWNAFDNNTSAGDYTFEERTTQMVQFHYGNGQDPNISDTYLISVSGGSSTAQITSLFRRFTYLKFQIYSNRVVRFWAENLPSVYNNSNFYIRINAIWKSA